MDDITKFLGYALISLFILGVFVFLFPVAIGTMVIDWVGNFTNSHIVWLFMWFFMGIIAFGITILFAMMNAKILSFIFTVAAALFFVFGIHYSVETYRGDFDYQEQYEQFENWDYREAMSGD